MGYGRANHRGLAGLIVFIALAMGFGGPHALGGVTWNSQNRYVKVASVQQPTAFGYSTGLTFLETITFQSTAVNLAPFDADSQNLPTQQYRGASEHSSFGGATLEAIGHAWTYDAAPVGNLYANYSWARSYFEVTFTISDPMQYVITQNAVFAPGAFGSPNASNRPAATLTGPGGQTVTIPPSQFNYTPRQFSGTLPNGTWRFVIDANSQAPSPNGIGVNYAYDYDMALTPEPGGALLLAGAGALTLVRRRVAQGPN